MEIVWLITAGVAVFGALIGSFANVLIFRFNSGQSIALDRSRCPHCSHTLAWFDLIPIFSYLFLRGACRYCHQRISIQYPIVEVVSSFAALYFFQLHWESLSQASLLYVIFMLLLILFVIDLRTFLLPDFYIVLLAIAVILYQAVSNMDAFQEQFWGVVVGSGFLLLLWLGTRGRGIGFGDVKLLIPLGLLFGLHGVLPLLLLAFVAGGAIGGVLLLLKLATPKTAIPFGPFLAGAAMVLLFYPIIIPLFSYVFLGSYNTVL